MNLEQEIKKHLLELEADDLHVRETARWQLTSIGLAAVPDLVHQLKTDRESCRREAAHLLGEIQAPSAAKDLVDALLDESIGVEWAAAEALIKYGPAAVMPLLEGITHHFDSERFRRGAFHVLHELDQSHQLDFRVRGVLQALGARGPRAEIAWTAERAIEHLRFAP